MAQAIISRKGGSGSGYAAITFNNAPLMAKNTNVQDLQYSAADLAAAAVGDYAMFAGGFNSVDRWSDTVNVYNSSLVKISSLNLTYKVSELAAATIADYALFGGGSNGDVKTLNAYDSNLMRWYPADLSVARRNLAAAAIAGEYALFGGGGNGNGAVYSTVDAYDSNLVHSTPTALSVSRRQLAAAAVGLHALFGGGYDNSSVSTAVDAYDRSLVRSTPTALTEERFSLAAVAVGNYNESNNYAIFAGGQYE